MTVPDTLATKGSQTLFQRLTEGRLPVGEALRYAMMLAERLRKLHDAGQVHGAVSPAGIVLADSNLELPPAAPPDEITPYTAPEVVSGRPAEAVSDIFSYGAVLYEMLTGRAAFEGATQAELAANIVDSQPVFTGSPAVDRLLASCLAKDPFSRCQRMQKVILELKLLAVAARKAKAAPRRDLAEARQEKAAEALNTVQNQIAAFSEQLAAAHERSARAEREIQSLNEHIGSRLVPNLESFAGRFTQLEQNLTGVADRLSSLEHNVAALGDQAAEARDRVAADIHLLETQLEEHTAAIEVSRAGAAQTDDLVERVVEALESLQASVLEQPEGVTLGVDSGGASAEADLPAPMH